MGIRKRLGQAGYETHSTDALIQLLRQDIYRPEKKRLSIEDTLSIVRVLRGREMDGGAYRPGDVDAAWADFQEFYLPEASGAPLDATPTQPRKRPGLFRRAVGIAAVFGLIVTMTLTAQVLGFDILGTIARWTAETFHFEVVSDAEVSDYSKVEITEAGLPEMFAPAWIPEGYEAGVPEIMSNSSNTTLYVPYIGEDEDFFSITLTKYAAEDLVGSRIFEKSDSDIKTHTHNGMTFYIMQNHNTYTAAWSGGVLVWRISGNLSLEELTKMIDSMGG